MTDQKQPTGGTAIEAAVRALVPAQMETTTDPVAALHEAIVVDPTALPDIGPDELHAIIQHAQYAVWDTSESGIELPYYRVAVPGDAVLHHFYTLLPDDPRAEHYRRCQTCARAIREMGNWVLVNYDGSVDSVLFPNIELPVEFRNGWTDLLQGMNDFITLDDGYTRPIAFKVCRPLDGASYPKVARADERHHFGVFTTPRQLVSARTLVKQQDRMYNKARKIIACEGFHAVNIAGLLEINGEDHTYSESVFRAINAASIVLWNMDEYAKDDEPKRNNIVTHACAFEEGLADFPDALLDILTAFEETPDYERLVNNLKKAGL